MLAWNRFVIQIKINFVCFVDLFNTHRSKRSFLCSTDEKNCVWDSFLKVLWSQHCVEQLWKITDVGRYWKFGVNVMLLNFLFMPHFCWLFSKRDFLSPDNFQNLPAYFSMIFIKTFQVRSDICNYLSWLVLFY